MGRGHKQTEEHRNKLRLTHIGKKFTEEHKNKIRESCRNCPVVHHINRNHFDDRLENRMIVTPREHAIIHMLQGDLNIFKKGYKLLEETKRKMSHSKLGNKYACKKTSNSEKLNYRKEIIKYNGGK